MVPSELLYFTISYALILLIGFFLINFLSNGFFGTFLRIKASRGKKVLVEVHAITDVYYKAGKFDDTILKFKTREKRYKSLIVTNAQVLRKLGVFCVVVDEVNNNVLTVNFNAKTGGNTTDYDHLLKRVMMAPQIDNMKDKIIMGLLVFLLVIGVISAFLIFNMGNQITQILTTVRVV